MLTRAEFTELAENAQRDPRPFIEGLLDIQTKQLEGQAAIQKLVFNKAQMRLHERAMAMRANGRPPRLICLKARQPGISTQCSGYVTATAITRPYSNSMQIAQDEDATIGLFRKIKFMLDRLPPELRPKLDVNRRDEIVLDSFPCAEGPTQLLSTVSVAWAGGKESWRSKTLQTVHLSEFAIMPRADEVLLGVLQSVPMTPQSLVIIESTARGIGNPFHEEWVRAESGESEFEAVFIPWFDLPENRMRPADGFTPDAEEAEMARAFGLDHAQLQWRRYKLYTECRGNIEMFNQEHPPTASEAFILSGRPAFNVAQLRTMYERAMALHPERGVYTRELGFTAYARGPLTVFAQPEAGHEYTIGADPSAGIAGGDPACAQVFDRTTQRQVAVWHGLLGPIPFAHVCNALGHWYNLAILAPELSGGYGHAMIEELKALQYPNLYVWSRLDKVKQVMTNFLGWETTYRTKQYLIDTSAFAIGEGELLLQDAPTIQEFLEFHYFDGTRAEGSGAHDDRVMAQLIAYRVHIESPLRDTGLPPRVKYEAPEAPPSDGPAMPGGTMNQDAWEDADADLGHAKRHGQIVDELVQPDDDDLTGMERLGIDHPW